jgi:hypothetical protein
VNSGDVGVANLKKRLGNMSDAAFQGMFRDFVISTHADDFVTSIGKYSQPSWNMRSMYSMVNQRFGVDWEFPSGIGLKDAQTKSQPIQSGGFQVYRFRGLSGTDSFIRVTGAAGSAMPPNVTITVIRTQ